MRRRWYEAALREKLRRPYVHIMFGARQTGKSTLLNALLPADALRIDLADPAQRQRFLTDPGEFAALCRALPVRPAGRVVFVDEVQAAPAIFDAVQHLFDSDRRRWKFVLCGSSARKLRHTGANLLPGRSFLHRLYPLVMAEQPAADGAGPSVLPLPMSKGRPARAVFPAWGLVERLAWGALPGVAMARERDRVELLRAYAAIHLEEEIRREMLVRDWGAFLRFLQFAAVESGNIINYAGIAQETGISQPTVKSYYQLLEDMFIGFRVPAYTRGRRKNLLLTPKYLFFDLGVRHAAAGLKPSRETVLANPGPLFEQWVGIELWKRLQYLGDGQLFYQRTRDGAEIDYVIERGRELIPLEVKWTERPASGDARHLLRFLREHEGRARRGYVVCRCPRPLQLHPQVIALPWDCL